jgi:hypothetical protein
VVSLRKKGRRVPVLILVIGPGQSTEDVKWLDEKLKEFFAAN